MAIILLLAVQIVTTWAGAHFLRQKRSRWPRSRIVLTAALPLPLLAGAFLAYIVGYQRLVEPVDEVRFDGAITLAIGAAALSLIGAEVAAAASRQSLPSDDVADIFS